MFTNTWLTLNRQTALMPKLTVSPKSGNVDVTALLKKNGKVDNTKNSEVDTVEISDTYKTTKKPDTSVLKPELEELVNYLRERAELRKPPVTEGFTPSAEDIKRMKATEEEMQRGKAIGAKRDKIVAKVKGGVVPNAEEMDFLKEYDPELYMDAKRLEREIQQFRNQLKNCDTKEERTNLVTIKKKMLAEEAKIILRASKNKKEPVFVLGMMTAMDREIEEDDKRNGIVKRADDIGIKMRNAIVGNAENGNVNDIETADSPKTSLDPEKKDSEVNEDDKGATRKPLDKPNTATHQYEKMA